MYTMPWSSSELVTLYVNLGSGYFFDKGTMKFFASKVTENFRRIDDQTALFITTEKSGVEDEARQANLRLAKLVNYVRESDGRHCQKIEIETVSRGLTLARAKTQMKNWKQD